MSRLRNTAIGLVLILLCSGCKKPPTLDCGADEETEVPAIGAVDSRYPLKRVAKQRYLVDKHETPFLMNGDTAWSLITQLTKEDVEEYLEDRRARGFNAILVNLLEHQFSDNAPGNAYRQPPFQSPGDFAKPCERYFRHSDWVIRKADEQGLLVVLCYCYAGSGCGSEGWSAEIKKNGVAKCKAYGEFLGRRYKDFPNIMWMAGGDCDASDCKITDEVNAMAEGIKETDKNHLHTAHCDRQRSALDCYDRPWLDINTTYSDCDQALAKLRKDYSRGPMPFFFAEGKYENEGATGRCLRSQAYWTILSGGFGHFFGNLPIWDFGADPKKSGRDWKKALNSDGANDMSRMGALFASRPWHLLVPETENSVVTAGTDNLAVAVASDKSTLIAYMPTERSITIDLTRLSGAQVKIWWYDPSHGKVHQAGTFARAGKKDLTPPGMGDWALIIDDVAKGFPRAGPWRLELRLSGKQVTRISNFAQ